MVCPSFIARDGMYAEMRDEAGVNAPIALRPVEPERGAPVDTETVPTLP